MASEILGLFTTPEQYQLAQQQARDAQALQYAKLDPRSQAEYGFFSAGQKLGGAIGGALGGEDPQLKMISQRQQLASQLDPSKPESFMQAAQLASQSGDQQFAIALADAGRQAAIQVAQANKERQLAVPADIQKAQQAASITQAIRQYKAMPQTPEIGQAIDTLQVQLDILSPKVKAEATPNEIQIAQALAAEKGVKGTPEYNAEYLAQLTRLTTKEPKERNIAFGAEAERKSKATYGKSYADLTPEQAGLVDKAVEVSEQAKAKASAILLPGQPAAPKDWLAFSSQISKDPVMDRTSTILADAPSAIETIRMSTTNDIAAASLPGSLARLTGEGKNMSNQDVNRFARTGGLDDRLAQDAVGFFTGRKTNVTKEQAERFATAVYRGALLERKKFIKAQAEQAGYDKTPNYDIAIRQLDDQLNQFKLINPNNKNKPQSPEASSTFDADKEKRYQEYKAKQSGVTR
jgi:hypothetical protein